MYCNGLPEYKKLLTKELNNNTLYVCGRHTVPVCYSDLKMEMSKRNLQKGSMGGSMKELFQWKSVNTSIRRRMHN